MAKVGIFEIAFIVRGPGDNRQTIYFGDGRVIVIDPTNGAVYNKWHVTEMVQRIPT